MRTDLNVEVPGLRVGFDIGESQFLAALKKRYCLFLSKKSPLFRIAVTTSRPAADRVVRPFVPVVESEPGRLSFSRGDARLTLTRRSGRGELSVWPNAYSFDAALRVLSAATIASPRTPGFLLHAAALKDGPRVYLFPGASGAGKSTLVRSVRGGNPLGDELVSVRRERGRFTARSTPFWGGGKRPRGRVSGTVAGLFFLRRASPPGIHPMVPARAQRRLLKCLLWFPGQPARDLERVWDELISMSGTVPSFSFSFAKGRSPLRAVREALR